MRLRPSERVILEAIDSFHGTAEAVVGGIHVSATIGDYGGTVRLSDGVVQIAKPSRDTSLTTARGRIWRRRWVT